MAFNAYLVFNTKGSDQVIGGESTSDLVKNLYTDDPKSNKGAIEVTDFAFGVSMPVTTSRSDGGGATVGRANFDVFTASKNIDTATTSLVDYCCRGTAINRIVLHLYRQGQGTADSTTGVVKYAMVVFGFCVITKVGISGGGEELPKESLEFNYGACEYYYAFTSHDTGLRKGSPMQKGWSLIANKASTSGQAFDDIIPGDKDWT
jgi:type VI secretion system Hcp family effector